MKKYFFVFVLILSQIASANQNLFEASEQGDVTQVKKILSRGQKINSQNKAGETALIRAANGGHLELVQFLVSKKADINQRDKAGHSALFYSISNNFENVSEFLMQKNSQIIREDLFQATQLGSVKTIEMIANKKATILKELNGDNETALFEAVRSSQLDVAKKLIELGVSKNQKNKKGQLAVDLADPKTDKKFIELLTAK